MGIGCRTKLRVLAISFGLVVQGATARAHLDGREYRFVPTEPTFRVSDPAGRSLGLARLDRVSTEHGVDTRGLRVFEEALPGSEPFLEFLSLRISPEPGVARDARPEFRVYIGFSERNDARVKALFRILQAVTILQLDQVVGEVTLNLGTNLTARHQETSGIRPSENFLIHVSQVRIRVRGQLIDVESLLTSSLTTDPYAFLLSLAGPAVRCKSLLRGEN